MFLHAIASAKSMAELVESAVQYFRAATGCEAVAIRLRQGNDFPYYNVFGFTPEFVQAERSLLRRNGGASATACGCLECRCGEVIEGRVDHASPYVTAFGSFFTNSTSEMADEPVPVAKPEHHRGTCVTAGYESVLLMPLRAGQECEGLVQCNDHRKQMFRREEIERWEAVGAVLAVALKRFRLEANLKASETQFRNILDAMEEGVFVSDARGRQLHWNAASLRLAEVPSGIPGEQLMPLLAQSFELRTLDGRVLPTEEWPMPRALRGEPVERTDYVLRRLDVPGWERTVRTTATTIRDPEGQVLLGILATLDITAAARAAAALRQSEERARVLFESISDGLAVHTNAPDGTPGNFLEVNQEFCDLLGYTQEELLRMSPHDLDDTSFGVDATKVGKNFVEGRTVLFEQLHVAKDGRRIPVEIHARPFTLGGESATLATIRDISKRREAERVLRESEQRLNLAVRAAQLGIWEYEHRSGTLEASPLLRTMFGLACEGAVRVEELQARILPDGDGQTVQLIPPAGDGAQATANAACRVQLGDGVRWLMLRSETYFEEQGERRVPVRTVGAAQDITRQKEAELEVLANRQQLRTAVDAARMGIWSISLGSDVLSGDALAHSIVGQSPEKTVHLEDIFRMVVPEDLPIVVDQLRRAYEANDFNGTVNFRIQMPNGAIRWLSVWAARTPEDQGLAQGLIGVVQDVTERMRTELALRSSRQQLRTALDSARLGIWTRELNSPLLQCDDLSRSIFGFESDEIITADMVFERIVPEDREAFFERRAEMLQEDSSPDSAVECRLQHPNGEIRWVNVRRTLLQDGTGKPTRLVGVVRDVTESRQAEKEKRALEQQLLHSQKMEAIGRLAGGIAHDFNNILMVIQSYAEMMEGSLTQGDPLNRNVQAIITAAERAAGLTAQMLAFSRKQVISPVALQLSLVVTDAAKMLQRLIGEDVELKVIPRSSWLVKADPDQLTQILMNLTVNARDAMPRGGTLTIATGDATIEEGRAGERAGVPPGHYAVLSVTDTGTGIPREVQERMFEPFFTTKSVGKGTGLGLSTVYGIVKQSGGHLLVNSEVGAGSTFTIYLPRVEGIAAATSAATSRRSVGGDETVLIVEDEDALRASIGEFLAGLGYRVVVAGSGPQALEAAGRIDGPLHLLITDMVMPKMGGRELALALAGERPGLKTIFMSGYTDDAIVRHEAEEQGVMFLQKPFSLAALARKMREALGDGGAVK